MNNEQINKEIDKLKKRCGVIRVSSPDIIDKKILLKDLKTLANKLGLYN